MEQKERRRIPYQWRLFLPLVILLWVILLGFAGWQSYRGQKYKEAFVEQQLRLINDRVSKAWKNGDDITLATFKQFTREFYYNDPLFDEIRMTIYNEEWEPVDTMGRRIKLNESEKRNLQSTMFTRESTTLSDGHVSKRGAYYLATEITRNGEDYYIISSLPNDEILEESIAGGTTEIWIMIFAVALFMTIVVYITARHMGKNISLLRQFAERTANDPSFIPGNDFAHDELGDIAQKLVKMYIDRATAREETEREHQMTIHTLEEKARQKRQMSNNINHELKTPIGVIKGYLDTIVDTPEMDEETRKHFLSKARDHARRLVNLVADVSAITRLEDGGDQIATEQLDFHEIVYVFANDARESGILGHFAMDVNIPLGTYINGNGNLLVGLLMNLTKNAVNYSGGDRIVVDYLGEDDTHYHFAFRDNGSGVPPASLEHLFDRFYRIDSGRSRKAGGTGLGLAIVYNTIQANGGTIRAQNYQDGGLEFDFSLRKWHI